MTEPLPGIELYLSTDKAAAEAAKYKAATDSAADAVLRIGDALGELQTSIDKVDGKGLATGLRAAGKDADGLATSLGAVTAQRQRELAVGREVDRDRLGRLAAIEKEKQLTRELSESYLGAAARIADFQRQRLRGGDIIPTFDTRKVAEATAGARRVEDAMQSAGRAAVASGRQLASFASGFGLAGITGAVTGFTDKMKEASTTARALATAMEIAAVAGASFGAAKVAGQLQIAISNMRALTAATIAYDAATGTSIATASRASKAISGLWGAMRANPLVSIAAGVGAVASALYLFGGSSDEAAKKAEEQRNAIAKLDDQYKKYQERLALTERVSKGPSAFDDRASQEADIRGVRDSLQKLGKELDAIKEKSVPLDRILGEAVPKSSAAAFAELRQLRDGLKDFQDRVAKLSGPDSLGLIAKSLADYTQRLAQFGVTVDAAGQPLIELARATTIVKEALTQADEAAKKAGVSLSSVGATADITRLSSSVAALIAERERELAISKKIGEAQLVLVLTEEAKKRKAVELNDVERKALADIAKRTIEIQKENEARRKSIQEAERLAELQRELPSKLEELRRKYEQELLLTRETGLAREYIRADIEAENRAKEIGLGLDKSRALEDAKALEDIKARGREIARLDFDRREAGGDKRGGSNTGRDDAMRELEQEERLVRLVGSAREEYRIRIEAENAARTAGLLIGSREYADYVKRKTAIAELGRTAEEVSQIFRDFGGAALASVEKLIDRTQKERDVVRALGEDLLRLAYRQTVVNNGLRLFETLGASFANLIGGGAAAGGTGATPPRSQPVAGYVPPGLGTQSLSSSLASSVFGQEAEPRRKRVGFGALEVNQGGGDIINMSFPGVRNASDARATRATLGQRVRQLKSIDRKGARGLRPQGQ